MPASTSHVAFTPASAPSCTVNQAAPIEMNEFQLDTTIVTADVATDA